MSVLENYKNIPRSPYGGRQGSNVILFFKFAKKSLEKKKEGGLSPPPTGDRPLSPVGWAIGPFFCQGPRCEFEEKNYT